MAKLAVEQLFQVNERFNAFVADNFLNIGFDARGYFVTRDPVWTMRCLRQDGWNVSLRGESDLQADDTERTYFDLSV
jgi:hypothetical protein